MRTVEQKPHKKLFSSPNMCREGRKSLPKKDVEQVMKYFFIKRCGKQEKCLSHPFQGLRQ